MKRKRVILAVVLMVAVVAVVAPNWWEIWLSVAYEKRKANFRSFRSFSGGFPVHEYKKGSLEYLKKKASWLPGSDTVLPNQVCWQCKNHHGEYMCLQDCVQEERWRTLRRNLQPESIPVPLTWRCTCTDPSHGDR